MTDEGGYWQWGWKRLTPHASESKEAAEQEAKDHGGVLVKRWIPTPGPWRVVRG